MPSSAAITPVLAAIAHWAVTDERILAVALVGSHARDDARPDSDVDLVVLTTDPESFRHQTQWVRDIPWPSGLRLADWRDADYGLLWSRHLRLNTGLEVEVGFAPPKWAATAPVDAGTRQVVANGCRIVLDPAGLLHRLVRAVAQATG